MTVLPVPTSYTEYINIVSNDRLLVTVLTYYTEYINIVSNDRLRVKVLTVFIVTQNT